MSRNSPTDATNSEFVFVEITDLKPLKILNSLRWTGKAKFPGALRGRSIVVFQIQEEIVAIPAFCPHEQANLAEAIFVSPYVLECPLHHNRYDLRTGVISTFEVELRDDTMYLLWNKRKNEAQPHKFAFEVPVELRGAQERIATLESELVALGRAAEIREQDTKSTVRQMGSMLLEVEQKSEALSRLNLSLVAANEFINRVTNAMREVLIVLDPQGHVTDANRRFYDLLGYLPEEVRGRGIERLMSEGNLAAFLARTTGQQQAEFETELITKQGERWPHLLRSALLHGPSGKQEGIVVVGTDIREIRAAQRELAAAYEKSRVLFDNMRQAVFVVIASGEIIEPVSAFSFSVFGDDIKGTNIFDLLFKDIDRKSEVFSALQTAFYTTFGADDLQWEVMEEYFPRRILCRPKGSTGKDEGLRILKVSYCPLRGTTGLMEKLMLVVEDITRIENLEKEMEREKQSNLRRIQIVEELAKNKLEELRRFFSSVSAILRSARETIEHPGEQATAQRLRGLHALKGDARMLGLRLISQAAHETEDAVVALGSIDTEESTQQLRSHIDTLHRLIAEHCHLAEKVLHIPNDFENESLLLLHRKMVDFDRLITGWMGPTLVRMGSKEAEVCEDVARLPSARAADQVRSALSGLRSAGVISEELQQVLGRVGAELMSLEVSAETAPIPVGELSRLRRAHLELVDVISVLCAESNACPAYALSRTRWVDLFVTLLNYTALVLQSEPHGARGIEAALASDAVIRAAQNIDNEYVLALFKQTSDGGLPSLSSLREAWRHLAYLSVVESLAMVRHADRCRFLASCAVIESTDHEVIQALREMKARGGLFMSSLMALHQRGVSPGQALGILRHLFSLDQVALVPPLFVSNLDIPNLADVLAAFSKERSPGAANALLTQLGAAGEVYRADDTQVSLYLKKVDLARQLRSVREVLSGNYQLLFERVQLLNVVSYNFNALKGTISRFKNNRTEQVYSEIESALDRLFDAPLIPALYTCYEMVAELAADRAKIVDFKITGDESLTVSADMLTVVRNALVHLLRNAIDHGIESPVVREQAGKSRAGVIDVECTIEGRDLIITVRDDGAGIDIERLVEKALAVGAISREVAERKTPRDALELMFLPRVSTAQGVTEVSGRGMGLDIVRLELARVGGLISVETEKGSGTKFVLTISRGL